MIDRALAESDACALSAYTPRLSILPEYSDDNDTLYVYMLAKWKLTSKLNRVVVRKNNRETKMSRTIDIHHADNILTLSSESTGCIITGSDLFLRYIYSNTKNTYLYAYLRNLTCGIILLLYSSMKHSQVGQAKLKPQPSLFVREDGIDTGRRYMSIFLIYKNRTAWLNRADDAMRHATVMAVGDGGTDT